MIYLVSQQTELFESSAYKRMSVEDSLKEIASWKYIQFDTETSGRDPHICELLCSQFGTKEKDIQIVVDNTTVPIELYKEVLEKGYLILQNAKFDLQFLMKHNIIARNIYDTMIVEQLIYLGYPSFPKFGSVQFSLKEIAWRRLEINIDKTVRGEIIWRGLDERVIIYAAGDVMYLEDIMESQLKDLKEEGLLKAAQVECSCIPSVAYMEWCGILLDQDKWKEKMKNDEKNLEESIKELNNFVIGHPKLKDKFTYVNLQGDLFTGFDTTPHVKINWSSSQQVVDVAKTLGFNTTVQDKKTGEDKDSVLEKELSNQKGICDDFLKYYFAYQGAAKVVSSFGQGHLNAVNPLTGRIHTTFKQLGAASGRFSCGGGTNSDLAKLRGIGPKSCKNPNLQQLPADEPTRSSFVAPKGYKFVSADFSAEESRLGADIYQDEEFYKEFTERSGDTHSMFAWAVFKDECIKCGCKSAQDVKKLAPQWRKKVKGVEFAYMFGAAAPTISKSAGCTVEEAQGYIDTLDKEFSGMASFARKGSYFVRKHGYIVMCEATGHRMHWWDFKKWKEREAFFKSPQWSWDEYREKHKGTGDYEANMVREHFQAGGKWDRMARNSVTQGTGAVIMKTAMTKLFNWIVDNNYFNIVHICVCVHDEINCDYPETLEEFPKVLTSIMEESAALYCKSLPIPACAEVGFCWVH